VRTLQMTSNHGAPHHLHGLVTRMAYILSFN